MAFFDDALGRRVGRTVGGATTAYLHDGLNVIQEDGGAGVTAILAGLGIDEHLMRTHPGGIEAILADALSSTVALIDGDLQIATEYTYEPFGSMTATGQPTGNGLTYTGREDDAAGLKYYRARYYHPRLQRFISEDPIEFASGDPNLYAYVGSNPIDRRDPFGLERQVSVVANVLAGGGPLLNGPFIGGGMGFAFTSNGQLVVQLQATGAYGVGLYAGAGVQGGISKTRCPTPDELSVQHAAQADLNVAIPPYSFGGSAQYDLDGGGGVQTPIPKLRLGVGGGAQASLGVTQTVNIPVTPKMFGRKPTPGCND